MTVGQRASAPTADVHAPPPAKQRLLWAAILASFVSFLDGSIVTIALPAIADELGGGIVLQQWVVSGYLLTLSALILVAGAVSDAVGRLRVLRIALVAFAVTTLACAAAPTGVLLVVARVLQGVAGALLVPGSLALIIAVFKGEEQGAAIGRWTAWTSVSGLVGPLLGGLLVDVVGWRWVFVLSVLPAVGSWLLLGRMRDGAHEGERQRIDVLSAALAALGLGGLVTGLIELGAAEPTMPRALAVALLVGGVVLLAAFVLQDRRAAHPLVPPALFRERNFTAGNLATLLIYAALGLASLVPVLFLQEVVRLPAWLVAVVGMPATLLLILFAGTFGRLSGRHGPRLFMTVGPLLAGAGALLMAFVPTPETALWFVVPGMVLVGAGLAVTVAPLTAAVLGAVPEEASGIGSAVNNAVARVAGLLAAACAGWVVGGALDLPGFARASVVTAMLLVAGGMISFAGIRNRVPQQKGEPA